MTRLSQELVNVEERKIMKSIRDSYYGIARINLKNLKFNTSPREISQANLIQLKGILEESCLQFQAGHRVPDILS